MLHTFDGTILFVSHDRYFVDRIASRIWAIDEGRLTQTLGNYTDYLRSKQRATVGQVAASPAPRQQQAKPEPGHLVAQRNQTPLSGDGQRRKAIDRAERDIGRYESKLNTIADSLAIAEIDQNYDEMARLSAEHDEAEAALEQAYQQWEALQDEPTAAAPAGHH
jgi:ATP-binding cassette, subfamily F, member 3